MKRKFYFFILLSILFFIHACGGGGSDSGGSSAAPSESAGRATVRVSLGGGSDYQSMEEHSQSSTLDLISLPYDVKRITLRVSNVLPQITADIPLDGSELVLYVEAKSGVRFVAKAYNNYGDDLYSAEVIKDLFPDEETTINLNMQPWNFRPYIQNNGNHGR